MQTILYATNFSKNKKSCARIESEHFESKDDEEDIHISKKRAKVDRGGTNLKAIHAPQVQLKPLELLSTSQRLLVEYGATSTKESKDLSANLIADGNRMLKELEHLREIKQNCHNFSNYSPAKRSNGEEEEIQAKHFILREAQMISTKKILKIILNK